MHGNMSEVLRALLAGAGVQAIPVNQPELVAEERELAEACQLEPGDVVWVSSQNGANIDTLRQLVSAHLT